MDAAALAAELFDVITPEDARASQWQEWAEGVVIKGGFVTADDVAKAKRLKIVSRNGKQSMTLFRHIQIEAERSPQLAYRCGI